MYRMWHKEDEILHRHSLATEGGDDFPPAGHRPTHTRLSKWPSWDFHSEHIISGHKLKLQLEVSHVSKSHDEIEDIVEAFLRQHFRTNETVYPSDVSSALDLEYDLVLKIFGKFVREGKLKE